MPTYSGCTSILHNLLLLLLLLSRAFLLFVVGIRLSVHVLCPLWVGVRGLGFGVWGLGLGFGIRVKDLVLGVWGSRFGV